MAFTLLFLTLPAFADTNCQPVYGGGQTCTTGVITIEKDVVNPQTNNDVHDLGINDPAFSPGQTVTFHITVRNIGNNNISSATVQDIFPSYLAYHSGPGNFDNNSQTLTFQIGNLEPNQAQTFTVTGTIVAASQLPQNQATCVINQAMVRTNDNQTAQDSSQFCIQTGVSNAPSPSVAIPQVIQTPATGASVFAWGLLIPMGITGLFLRTSTLHKGGIHR